MTKRILIVENHENCPYRQYVSELRGFICGRIYNEKRRIVGCYREDDGSYQEDDFPEECQLVKVEEGANE